MIKGVARRETLKKAVGQLILCSITSCLLIWPIAFITNLIWVGSSNFKGLYDNSLTVLVFTVALCVLYLVFFVDWQRPGITREIVK
jgi:hypothetical protein